MKNSLRNVTVISKTHIELLVVCKEVYFPLFQRIFFLTCNSVFFQPPMQGHFIIDYVSFTYFYHILSHYASSCMIYFRSCLHCTGSISLCLRNCSGYIEGFRLHT